MSPSHAADGMTNGKLLVRELTKPSVRSPRVLVENVSWQPIDGSLETWPGANITIGRLSPIELNDTGKLNNSPKT